MADYNPYTVGSYQMMAQTMSQSGGGRNMSGLGARSSNMTTAPKGTVDFTTIDTKTGKQTDVATLDYGNDDGGTISPTVIYSAAANAATEAGSIFTPQGPTANAMNLYSMPNMVESVSDYVYRADRNEAIEDAISGTQAEEQAQVDAAIKSINKAITQGKTDAEIAEAFLNDMGGFGNDKPDETGGFGVPSATLKDVTGTDAGAITNPQPLYDFAEEMANPSITTTELPPITADQKEKLGAKLRDASDKGDLSSVMNQLAQDSKIQLSSAVTNFIEGAETQVASNDIDPFTGLPIGGDELGFTDVSPSAEAQEQRGLMARNTASDERQDPSFWDRVLFGGAEPEAEAPAVNAAVSSPVADIVEDFVDEMENLEGLGGDDLLGDREPTYSYGITKKKADEFGIKPSDYSTMRDFAEDFAERYMEEKEAKYTDIFEDKTNKEKIALHSYLYNAGKFYPAQLRALNNDDMAEFVHEMRDVVKSEGKAVTGLSKRRAAEANMIGEESIEGWKPITEVQVRGTKQKPIFDWVTEDGTVVETYESNVPLHSGSTMNTVSVN